MAKKAKGKEGGKRKKERKKGQHKGKGTAPVRRAGVSAILEKAHANKEAISYVALFSALCLAFYLLYYFLTASCSVAMVHLRENTARILGAFLSLVGMKVMVNGVTLSINGFSLEIIDECTAVFSSIVYCACILAYPTTLKNKGIGLALGVPSLYAINILRLVILALVGIFQPNMFEFVHVYLWQASFIIFVVVLFLLWLHFLSEERTCAKKETK